MRMLPILLATLTVAAAAVPAAAQSASDPAALDTFAICVARQLPDRAKAFLHSAVGSQDERRGVALLTGVRSKCFDAYPTPLLPPIALRGALSEVFLRIDYLQLRTLRAAPVQTPIQAPRVNGRQFVMGYARCLTDAEKGKAIDLIRADHGSKEERDAFRAFGPVLSACMPDGMRYRVDIGDVRSHIAARLYQIAYDGQGGAGA